MVAADKEMSAVPPPPKLSMEGLGAAEFVDVDVELMAEERPSANDSLDGLRNRKFSNA